MKRFAKAPWVFVWLGLAICFFTVLARPVVKERIAQARLARVRTDYARLWAATRSLGLDNCGIYYPADTGVRRRTDSSLPLTFETVQAFKRRGVLLYDWRCLTTPVVYMGRLPEDPFNPGHSYGYAGIKTRPDQVRYMGILQSPGPDGKNDVDLADLQATVIDHLRKRPYQDPNPQTRAAIRQLIDPYLYDPTNGTSSQGDLVLVMDSHRCHYGFGLTEPPSRQWTEGMPPEIPLKMIKAAEPKPANPGAPSSEASLSEDESAMAMLVNVPAEFYEYLVAAGVLRQHSGRYADQLNEARLQALSNHLDPFHTLFESPEPMSREPEKQALAAWKQEDPQWWAVMEKICTGVSEIRGKKMTDWNAGASVYAHELHPILILYGKSQILKAAEEAGQHQNETALSRVTALRLILQHCPTSAAEPGEPAFARVFQELRRLCDALEKSTPAGNK